MAAHPEKPNACAILTSQLPGQVSSREDASYSASIDSYFYQQARLAPLCIVFPKSSSDVAIVVRSLKRLGVKAAVRGGGHSPVGGAANGDDAVTVDLSGLNAVRFGSADANEKLPSEMGFLPDMSDNGTQLEAPNILSVGGGATWGDVYRSLDYKGLIAIGGRGMSLGVGGLLTGGGISFYSGQRGFACDNIVNMEFVLASGSIVNANASQHADLLQAIKGGSNNFGIVTRFDLKTYPQGQLWGGFIAFPASTIPEQLSAFAKFMCDARGDPYAAVICAIGFVGVYRRVVVSVGLHYTKPVVNPLIFRPFTAIQPQPRNTMRIASNLDFVKEVESNQAKN